jgi:CRISPR-associated protein Cmr2
MSLDPHDWDDPEACLLSFFLGPVQTFIEAAKTVRDLWTGSYLLSWLTFQAMRPILDLVPNQPERGFVFPAPERIPLLDLYRNAPTFPGGEPRKASMLTPCLPNKFLAVVPGGPDGQQGRDLAQACEDACRAAWESLATDVHQALRVRVRRRPELAAWRETWDRLWADQVASYFEIRTAVVPRNSCDLSTLERWIEWPASPSVAEAADRLWTGQMELLAGVMEARRSVRHVPDYHPTGDVPQKCSLLGSFEQMGPAKLEESKNFWGSFSRHVRLAGSRTEENERYCAISLVKRFAWPAHWSNQLQIKPQARRFADTATVAAAHWLKRSPIEIDPDAVWRQHKRWSGQWLHWLKRDQEKDKGEPRVPSEVWRLIEAKRAPDAQGPPPTYYAVLMMDGDHMGRWLRGEKCKTAGRDLQTRISTALSQFAIGQVQAIVEGSPHRGTVIYAGGDDVLALLPTESVLDCAGALRTAYEANWPIKQDAEPATMSAGIAVVHHKDDLRFALETARRAEKAAKGSGRDTLALTVCRRSGEQTTALLPWDLVGDLHALLQAFRGEPTGRKGVSDRWTYKLKAAVATLRGLPWEAAVAEGRRLILRTEDEAAYGLRSWYDRVIEEYHRAMTRAPRNRTAADALEGFVTLCQSASFLARGRDQ